MNDELKAKKIPLTLGHIEPVLHEVKKLKSQVARFELPASVMSDLESTMTRAKYLSNERAIAANLTIKGFAASLRDTANAKVLEN